MEESSEKQHRSAEIMPINEIAEQDTRGVVEKNMPVIMGIIGSAIVIVLAVVLIASKIKRNK
ncbi:MAG: hypothetical protein MJ154_00800 [Candidatus Saccharibacteria bacterium]|nr:hypothetical protein [Candidatus Saccharibacteria bacterium]